MLCLPGPERRHTSKVAAPVPRSAAPPRVAGWYAWVPVLGPLAGGAVAGAVFKGYVRILKGQVSVDSNPWATTALANSSVTQQLDATALANGSLDAAGNAPGSAALDVAPIPKLFL